MTFIESCTLFEAVAGVPHEHADLPVSASINTEQAFDCVKIAVNELKRTDGWWYSNVTHENVAKGELELGAFRKSNVAGYRVKALHDKPNNKLQLELKGLGPYYTELPVPEAFDKLMSKVKPCINGIKTSS